MERIPEPELMEDEEQAHAYARADFSEPHSRFVELLRNALPELPAGGLALDLGCGPADVTIRFARAFPGWAVDGIDGSAAMLRLGREAVRQAQLGDRIALASGRLPDAEAPRDRYDLVFSNSLLHHLREPSVLWACVRRWAAPEAAVFVMDLARPPEVAAAWHLVHRYAANEPEILRRDFLRSLLAAYRPDEVRAQLQTAGLTRLRVEPVGDRHLVVWGRR
jgi:SAM-dependent methyltransferase